MKIAVFSSKPYDEKFIREANNHQFEFEFFESRLNPKTVGLAEGAEAVCAFVNDDLGEETLRKLSQIGVTMVALRCAGFNNVHLSTAKELGIKVARVPAYSPYAVAEHALALLLTLNRRIHKAHNRIRENNFSLDGLLGFDLHGRTVGVIGTGKIGNVFIQILSGFGMNILAYDPYPNPETAKIATYVALETLFSESDVISLHCPLTPETKYVINQDSISRMKTGVYIVNTSRGALVKTAAAIEGLRNGKIGGLAIDVYEEEADLFFDDHSNDIVQDEIFGQLQTFPNVLVTGHQAFFTQEALTNIAETTLQNLRSYALGESLENSVY